MDWAVMKFRLLTSAATKGREFMRAVKYPSIGLMPFRNSSAFVPEQRCYLASSNCGFLRRRFMSTTSLRMQATSATFGFLPAARSFK